MLNNDLELSRYNSLLFFLVLLTSVLSCSSEKFPCFESSSSNYYDLEPDTLTLDSLKLDVNCDGKSDVKLLIDKEYDGSSPSSGFRYVTAVTCVSLNSSIEVVAWKPIQSRNGRSNGSQLIDKGVKLTNELQWSNREYLLRGQVFDWNAIAGEKYIGMKIKEGESIYFGWIRIELKKSSSYKNRYSITCYDYAISQPNKTIRTGRKR